MNEIKNTNWPESIQIKLDNVLSEANKIVDEAEMKQKTSISGKIHFRYEQSAPKDILTDFERAQSVCFVIRYECLPILSNTFNVFENNGKFFLKDIHFLRHMLNEYRSLICNQKDSVYYAKIHKFCYEKLKNKDKNKNLSITVYHEKDDDITNTFIKFLSEKIRSIKFILQKSEFGYIYNAILQHSDHSFTERFWKEYYNGEINYIFIKHALLLNYIRECLRWHYTILNQLTFPKLGPL